MKFGGGTGGRSEIMVGTGWRMWTSTVKASRICAKGSYGRTVGAWEMHPSTPGNRHLEASQATSRPLLVVGFELQHEPLEMAIGLIVFEFRDEI